MLSVTIRFALEYFKQEFLRTIIMCGRVVQAFEEPDIRDVINLTKISVALKPSYNIAPSQEILGIFQNEGGLELSEFIWGLLPSWAENSKTYKPQINARAEGITEKPFFRDSFRKRRCLVAVSGFYEWKKEGESKNPYFIFQENKKPILLAGVWEVSTGTRAKSLAIITTEANESVSILHHRMPVVIDAEDSLKWLLGATEETLSLLVPSKKPLSFHPVSKEVNSPFNNSKDCILSVGS